MTDEQIVSLIQQGINIRDNMEKLYNQTYGFIKNIARKYGGIDNKEDLIQEGYIALANAVKSFDGSKYDRFITCLHIHLKRQYEKHFLWNTKSGMITKNYNSYIGRYQKLKNYFRAELNRDPDLKEYVAYLNLSVDIISNIEKMINDTSTVSIDCPIEEDDNENLNLGILLSNGENIEEDVIDSMMGNDLKKGLWDIVKNNTSQEEFDMLRSVFQLEMSVVRYASLTGISRKEAINIYNRALGKIRRYEIKKLIIDLFEIEDVQDSHIGESRSDVIDLDITIIENIEKELEYISYVLTATVDGISLLDKQQIKLAIEHGIIDENYNQIKKWEKPKQGFELQPVDQYDEKGVFIKHWNKAGDASEHFTINTDNIRRCCKGVRKTAGGFVWKYSTKEG